MTDKIEVENINIPGQVSKVDRVKYENVRAFMLALLPATAPGLTHKEIMTAAKLGLDQSLFPDGRKSGWWTKSVQLDLEAKSLIKRADTKPLRWYKV